MKKKNKVHLRHKNRLSLPSEIVKRFKEIEIQTTLKEQLDFFTEKLSHNGKRCRWARPLQCLPYHHIIEEDPDGGSWRIHLLINNRQQILSLERVKNTWRVQQRSNQEQVATIIPRRHFCRGWIKKPVRTSTMRQLCANEYFRHSGHCALTEANAQYLLLFTEIQRDLEVIRALVEQHQPHSCHFKEAA